MAEKLLVISDMWGIKKGLWITSYFGYLQQYYDIDFFDCQQLAGIDEVICSKDNLHNAFVDGGIETAANHLLTKVANECHVLAFSTGGTIAWKAALKGMPVKSLTLVSSTRLRLESERPKANIRLIYGGNDPFLPSQEWAKSLGVSMEVVPNFGHELYSDEKIIDEVSLKLLEKVTKKAV